VKQRKITKGGRGEEKVKNHWFTLKTGSSILFNIKQKLMRNYACVIIFTKWNFLLQSCELIFDRESYSENYRETVKFW